MGKDAQIAREKKKRTEAEDAAEKADKKKTLVSHTAVKKLAQVAEAAKAKARDARKAALKQVKTAKEHAAEVASDPHASIKQIEAAEKNIQDAHHAFRKAKIEQAKAHGAKKMEHEVERQEGHKGNEKSSDKSNK